MPDPSMKSYDARCGRYYRRAFALWDEWLSTGSEPSPEDVASMQAECRKLDEIFAYLTTRTDGESLKDWRARRRAQQLELA